jgi:hypothetical protein
MRCENRSLAVPIGPGLGVKSSWIVTRSASMRICAGGSVTTNKIRTR